MFGTVYTKRGLPKHRTYTRAGLKTGGGKYLKRWMARREEDRKEISFPFLEKKQKGEPWNGSVQGACYLVCTPRREQGNRRKIGGDKDGDKDRKKG